MKQVLNGFHCENSLVYYYLSGRERTKYDVVLFLRQLWVVQLSNKYVLYKYSDVPDF